MDASSSGSRNSKCDSEEQALDALLGAFGLVFSLEEIAAAYCKAGRNPEIAGDILYGLRGESSLSNGEPMPENAAHLQKSSKRSKPRKVSVSMGTVSSVLGKGYSRPTSSVNNSYKTSQSETTKPMKLEIRDPFTEELASDMIRSNSALRHQPLNNKDVEDFLFAMLGDGFQLGKEVIRDVLCSCGYDAKKGMDTLLNMSTTNKDNHVTEKSTGASTLLPNTRSLVHAESDGPTCRNGTEPKLVSDPAMDILKAWYGSPERTDDVPKKTCRVRTRASRRPVVSGPPEDFDAEPSPEVIKKQSQDADKAAEEDKYQELRKAAKVNWDAMKAYYEVAVDAFVSGNHTQAKYLLEQGKFYNKMAREADEKSAGEILEARSMNSTEVTLDLHLQQPEEAIHLLKINLNSFSGLSNVQFLKIILETNAEDITKGARRRRLVIKLLEKHSITWTEGNAGTILIKMDEIDPRKLSFAKAFH